MDTRAFVLYKMGIELINVYWDRDKLDWKLYETCVKWCIQNQITDISHLKQKIIGKDEYQRLWINRCKNI